MPSKLRSLSAREIKRIHLDRSMRSIRADIARTAKRVAPKKARTLREKSLQTKWKADPTKLDMSGTDTRRGKAPRSKSPLRARG